MRLRVFLTLLIFSFAIPLAFLPALLLAQGEESLLPPFTSSSSLYLLYEGSSANRAMNQIVQVSKQGEITTALTGAQITAVSGEEFARFDDRALGFGPDGTLYFSENSSDALFVKPRDGELAILTSSEEITQLLPITTSPGLGMPAVGLDGDIYLIERTSDTILRIDTVTGEPTVFVSRATLSSVLTSTDNLFTPLVFDTQGFMYVIEQNTDQILKIDAAGTPATFVPPGEISTPRWLAFDPEGNLLVEDSATDAIYRVTPQGQVSAYLTSSEIGAPLDVDNVLLNQSIAIDSQGNLYIHEGRSNAILRFDSEREGTVLVTEEDFEAAIGFTSGGNVGMAFAPGYPMWLPELSKH
jgi:hypothetical protein